MNTFFLRLSVMLLAAAVRINAEEHHATHLGNPATRFAPTLVTVEDLRARFRDEKLRPDFAEILKQWGWQGSLADLFGAVATNAVTEIKIPVGTVMPFMSSREGGRPICLRNVTWSGKEPVSAFAFYFTSKDRRYRCVTPKPCSNFFLEDLGPVPKPALALDCSVPEKVPLGRTVRVCLTARNTGEAADPKTMITLKIPVGATVTNLSAGATVADGKIAWEVSNFAARSSREFCTTFLPMKPGLLNFDSALTGGAAKQATSSCATTVFGIAAILLEKADNPDPVAIGTNTTYTVKVTNQGTADDTNVQMVVNIAPELVPVSAPQGTIDGQAVTFPVVPSLAPKAAVSYTIIARGVKAGDGRTIFTLSSGVLKSPITAEESTTVY